MNAFIHSFKDLAWDYPVFRSRVNAFYFTEGHFNCMEIAAVLYFPFP